MLFATIPSIEIKCCTKYMGTEVHDKKTKKDIYLLCYLRQSKYVINRDRYYLVRVLFKPIKGERELIVGD